MKHKTKHKNVLLFTCFKFISLSYMANLKDCFLDYKVIT